MFDPMTAEEIAALKEAAETDMASLDPLVCGQGLGLFRLLESHEHFRELAGRYLRLGELVTTELESRGLLGDPDIEVALPAALDRVAPASEGAT